MPVVAGYSAQYNAAFFTGSPSATDLVPGIYHIAIDGHPYLLDLSHDDVETIQGWMREETLPLLRPQADQSTELGEQSLSPEQMWRRSQSTWHKGAGQTHLDRDGSDRARFRASKGVDPWTRWELGLLEATVLQDGFTGGSGSSVLIVNSRAYASSGLQHLRTSPDPLSVWANVTVLPAANCSSLCTDGVKVYQAWNASGIFVTDSLATPTTTQQGVTGTVTRVAYVKGRLLAANAAALYEVTNVNTGTPPPLPTAFYTHTNPSWAWTGFAEGDGFIYAAGFAGSSANVYKITVEQETVMLAKPKAAMQGLPPGEVIHSIHGALGFVFLGTSRGVRFCVPTSNGDLRVGSLINTGSPVRFFITWDRFTYFGWSGFDAFSSGLGRLDPAVINEESGALVPAYASDVMAGVTGTVNSVAILPGVSGHGHPVFTIDGSGVWRCVDGQPVVSGELRTGLISYGIADEKIAAFLEFRHGPLPAGTTVAAHLITDDGAAVPVGTSSTSGSSGSGSLTGQQKRGELFELVFILTGKTSVSYAEPALRRWTLRAIPAPTRPSSWTMPILLTERLLTAYDIEFRSDPLIELSFLRGLRDSKRIVTFQLGTETFQVVVDSIMFLGDRNTGLDSVPTHSWTGKVFVTLMQVSG